MEVERLGEWVGGREEGVGRERTREEGVKIRTYDDKECIWWTSSCSDCKLRLFTDTTIETEMPRTDVESVPNATLTSFP